MLPKHLILIRHALSEGNRYNKWYREGKLDEVPDSFQKRHPSLWRLTEDGVVQAKKTGDWIRGNMTGLLNGNCKFYLSPYVRAQETAGHLQIPNAQWCINPYLRERNWGKLEREDQNCLYPGIDDLRKSEIMFWWTPPEGESLADVSLRLEKIVDTWARECSEDTVWVTSHGETLMTMRSLIEHWTPDQIYQKNCDPDEDISNCQIIHYSRINPYTGEEANRLKWYYLICPQKNETNIVWKEVVLRKYTNQDLLEYAAKVPRLIQ